MKTSVAFGARGLSAVLGVIPCFDFAKLLTRPTSQRLALAGLAIALGCTHAPAPTTCEGPALADSIAPSREAFFREVLFAGPTARTPRFDAYTPTSYSVEKLDLVSGLHDAAATCHVDLDATLVLGPVGPLWAYYVVPFLQDGDRVRVNVVVMPHARITSKATGVVDQHVADDFLRNIISLRGVSRGSPMWPDSIPAGLGREFSYDLLVVRYERGEPQFWHGAIAGPGTDTSVVNALNAYYRALAAALTPTYPDSTVRSGSARVMPNVH